MLALSSIGCGDDDGDGGDTPSFDAAPDEPDAGGETEQQSGEIIFFEARFNAFAPAGTGPLVGIKFFPADERPAPVWEEAPGSPLGCKVWDLTGAQWADPGIDIGTFQLSVDGIDETYPPCVYNPGIGYLCASTSSSGGDIAVADAKMGIASITDERVTWSADEVGRTIFIQNAGMPSNNGAFAVLSVEGNTIRYRNPGAVAETATAGSYTTLIGFGPTELPDTMPDDAMLTVELTKGGEGNIDSFSRTLDVGDDFVPDDATAALLDNIPLDGQEFELGCNGEGGTCNMAQSTAVNIETTDAALPEGLPPFVFLPPVTKSIRIFCISLAGSATVPAEASAYLMDPDITRIRTTFARANASAIMNDQAALQVITGHGAGGFTDP
ncbi:MAG TPA: hypothetical protein VFU21_07600 [Kofleriaceae bacterium]|nr:hypothetical protein [Kofleriaceae bacterium]